MRPLKLELCGFGTYCKKTIIDLESLGNSGLYLICGDTGSGKSTIFDAISYVLFGHSSGDSKNEAMLRSTFAGPETETYVKLDFEHQGKKYTVRRNPAFFRKALKGEGVAKENANAWVRCNDEDAASGLTAVNDYIKDLLGLEQKQFSQIVMIAQGEFQKILFAETSKRVEIFRKLFKTENYQKLQERLSYECSLIKDSTKELKNSYENFVSSLVCEEDDPNSVLVKQIQKDELTQEKSVEIIKQIICLDEKLLEKEQKKDSENNKKIEEITIELTELDAQKNKISDLEIEKHLLEEKSKTEEIIKKDFEAQKEKQTQKHELESEYTIINSKMDQYDVLSNTQKDLASKQKELDSYKEKSKEIDLEIQKDTEQEKLLNEEQEELKNCDSEFVEVENQIQKLKDKEQQFKDLNKKFTEYFSKNESLLKSQKEYLDLQKEAEVLQTKYLHIKKIFMDNQAGILARDLVEGECCPVCGSKSHPKPALMCEENISKDQVDELEIQTKQKEELVNQANLKASNEKTALETLFSQLAESVKRLLNKELEQASITQTASESEKEENNCKTELVETEIKFNIAKKNCERKKQIGPMLEQIKDSLEKNKDDFNHTKEQILNSDKDLGYMKKQIAQLQDSLEFDSLESAKKYERELKQQIDSITKNFESVSNRLKDIQIEVSQSKARIKLMEKECSNFSLEKYDSVVLEKQKFDEQKERLQESITRISHRVQTNKSVLEKIQKILVELETKDKKFQWVNALSRTANGNVGNGKFKILLETFVQRNFLDKVISLANKRLNIMSDGQYDLIRKTEGDDKVSLCGLDINVIDHYQGGERSVRSLSGGESFEASLALALGLSDVITNYAGGIKIDTMFIDEGFGTLDGETLQKAFKALTSISEGNDKLIGIISHVDLLKEKIPKQIRVTKTVSEGSNVQIVS